MDEFHLTAALWRLGFGALAVAFFAGFLFLVMQRGKAKGSQVIDGVDSLPQAAGNFWGLVALAIGLILAACLGGCSAADASPMFPDRYDRQIKSAVEQYWGDFPKWAAWKGQLYQESRLDPAAVSPVGAQGLAQFMPGTWEQITRELRLGRLSPFGDEAIAAGAYYMAKLRHAWSSPRPALDRQQLAQASYNGGLGSLIKAQSACGGTALYEEIVICLPEITGAQHAKETTGYIVSIAKWQRMMEAGQ